MAPLPRFEKLPSDKRRVILDAAAAEFASRGFEGASFNRIIAAAGVSKGAMYYYFADKADAYGAVLDHVLERLAASLGDLPRPEDAGGYWATMAAGTERMSAFLLAEPQLAALARGLYERGGADATYRRLLERIGAWVDDLLAMGQGLGAVRSDVPRSLLTAATTGLLVSADRWFTEALRTENPDVLMALTPKLLELFRDLLEPR